VDLKHIKLIENSGDIEHHLYHEIFKSKLHSLTKMLNYFERYEIDATIKFGGHIHERRLKTTVEVECDDDVFKRVIEENVKKFRHPMN
jgi:hypothetical protein